MHALTYNSASIQPDPWRISSFSGIEHLLLILFLKYTLSLEDSPFLSKTYTFLLAEQVSPLEVFVLSILARRWKAEPKDKSSETGSRRNLKTSACLETKTKDLPHHPGSEELH